MVTSSGGVDYPEVIILSFSQGFHWQKHRILLIICMGDTISSVTDILQWERTLKNTGKSFILFVSNWTHVVFDWEKWKTVQIPGVQKQKIQEQNIIQPGIRNKYIFWVIIMPISTFYFLNYVNFQFCELGEKSLWLIWNVSTFVLETYVTTWAVVAAIH